jgi:hypothetical protein
VVVFESLLLNGLSQFRAVTPSAVGAGHGVVLMIALAVAWRRGWRITVVPGLARRALFFLRGLGLPGILVGALLLLVASSTARYLPSNWDSMTYHLARVAYWIMHGSVEPYPTHIDRQVVLQPGAEYVIAALQITSGSDRLAGAVQLVSWVLAVLASPALARVAGAPRRLAPWAAVVIAALPMGVLQASSTQNDLVAAVLALGVVAAVLPFLHRTRRWRLSDAVILGVALAAAALVKLTALVAAVPFLLVALVRTAAASARRPREGLVAVAVAIGVAAIPVAPEIARRLAPELAPKLKAQSAAYVYSGMDDLADRWMNLARGVVRHVPAPPGVVRAVGIDGWCLRGEELCRAILLRRHEDNAGNPLHVGIAIAVAVLAITRWRRLPARGRIFVACVPASWVLFHFAFRDNTWISRLETPTYVLLGLTVAVWGRRPAELRAGGARGGRARGEATLPRGAALATALVCLAAFGYGAKVALSHETRPPLSRVEGVERAGYYANQPNTKPAHDLVLRAASALRCDRVGLFIGGDSFDYPLTWRAMKQGVEVRHVFGADPWPCLVFADTRPPGSPETLGWSPTPYGFLYVNAVRATAAESGAR